MLSASEQALDRYVEATKALDAFVLSYLQSHERTAKGLAVRLRVAPTLAGVPFDFLDSIAVALGCEVDGLWSELERTAQERTYYCDRTASC